MRDPFEFEVGQHLHQWHFDLIEEFIQTVFFEQRGKGLFQLERYVGIFGGILHHLLHIHLAHRESDLFLFCQ